MSSTFPLVGFEFIDGSYKEYLPNVEQARTKEDQRAIFLSMYNFYMPEHLRLDKKGIDTKKTIYQNFVNKILTSLPISYIRPYNKRKTFKPDIISTMIISNFLGCCKHPKAQRLTKGLKLKKGFMNKKPKLAVAELITMIHKHSSSSLLFDLDDAFSNLVYERIKKVNQDKKISSLHDGITIQSDTQSTYVLTNFKSFDFDTLHFSQEIKLAQEKLKDKEHQMVYLVYPKREDFRKHIELKFPELALNEEEYRVKLIPYSFSFCLKNSKGKCKCK